MTKAELDTLRTFAYLNSRNGRTIITAQSLDCREKPFGRMAARSIGNINDLKHGTSGLEKELDSLLYGKPGVKKKVQLTTAIKEWEDIAAINGYDILTTIDVQIQDILETELYNMCVEQEPEWATAVLMDVKTGDIKAISNLSWNETAHDYIETVNHAVRSWELGSVMKPISLAIAIEDGFVHASTPVTIGASFPYAQARPITDTHSIGANPTVTEVLAGSSNIGTARIITSHYGERPWEFRKRLEEIGFFESLNIGISGESKPTIQPLGSPDKRMENPWRINLSRCCYGYAVQQSPVTNLAIINAIANDGKFVRPRLVKELWRNDSLIKSNPVSYVRKQAFSPKTASEVRSMLRAVVWSDRKGVPTAPRLQTTSWRLPENRNRTHHGAGRGIHKQTPGDVYRLLPLRQTDVFMHRGVQRSPHTQRAAGERTGADEHGLEDVCTGDARQQIRLPKRGRQHPPRTYPDGDEQRQDHKSAEPDEG